MHRFIISYDLGTGGLKTSLYRENGQLQAFIFIPYETTYPHPDFHEQAPEDWWSALIQSTRELIKKTGIDPLCIEALAISGHSLGCVPLDHQGNLLREKTPIWSDKRASQQAQQFFQSISYEDWYQRTGNGFPPECYTLFKILWYKEHEPDLFAKTAKIIGTKDYCNFKLTGRICTDYSYASGCGAFDLQAWDYYLPYIEAAELSSELFPEIISSESIVGTLTEAAALATGLSPHTKVICGGVDNSCMALGARGTENGRIYTSLGSSAWIALISHDPVLDFTYKPYVFSHVIKGLYTSATCIFSAGTSLRWVRDTLCPDLIRQENEGGENAYLAMDKLAEQSPIGARQLIFNPSLAGGSMLEEDPAIQGGYAGINLAHTRADMIRAAMEGVSLNLKVALNILSHNCPHLAEMLIVGGGSKSSLWMQIFADIYNLPIIKSVIDQDAAALGAAALAAKGAGLWDDFSLLDSLHILEKTYSPLDDHVLIYQEMLPLFEAFAHDMAKFGAQLKK